MKSDVEIYCACMEELLARMHLVDSIFARSITTGNNTFDAEFVFLQFRKILELIAFSSLAANKDVYMQVRAQFATDWQAARILSTVEEVNKNFYPEPFVLAPQEKGSQRKLLVPVKEGFLTKEDFINLYDHCASFLHTKNPYRNQHKKNVEHPPKEWLSRIQKLVKLHRTRLATGKLWLGAVPDIDGKIHTYTAEPL